MLELKSCGVAAARRFTFFDQVHTTGVDVEQTLSARAAMTLGKAEGLDAHARSVGLRLNLS